MVQSKESIADVMDRMTRRAQEDAASAQNAAQSASNAGIEPCPDGYVDVMIPRPGNSQRMTEEQYLKVADAPTRIRYRIEKAGARFHASDNISAFIEEGEHAELIETLTKQFKNVLDALVIDTENDPNSHGTAKRLAKMYVNELMAGRYFPSPDVTAFPNIASEHQEKYEGMLVVRAEIKSMCSHHHQPVKGTCFIGILPSDKVIGLSKYARIAQHCARRGTLQEDLVQMILKEIQKATDCRDVGVHIVATHGCMENRGVMAHSSLTQTTALSGQFFAEAIKKEFFDNIALQTRITC